MTQPRILRQAWPALIAGLLFSGPVCAADEREAITTRFGEVSAIESTPGVYTIAVDGRDVGVVADDGGQGEGALDVTLYRATPRGDDALEFVIVDLRVPGMHCRHEFFLLALAAGASPRLSAAFGECEELEAAEVVDDGVIVTLVDTFFDGDGDGYDDRTGPAQRTRYRWRDGVVTALDSVAVDTPQDECGVLVGDNDAQLVVVPSLHVAEQTDLAGPFVLPPDAPPGVHAIQCRRASIVPRGRDFEVLLAGYPLALRAPDDSVVWLELEDGQVRVSFSEDALDTAQMQAMQAWLDRVQPCFYTDPTGCPAER